MHCISMESQPGVDGSPWPNLPTDLLLDVSGRLHDAGDFVRFHAICQPWRDAALSLPAASARRHTFLPWLLSQKNARNPMVYFGSVSLDASTSRRWCKDNDDDGSPFADETSWVAGADGKSIWLFTGGPQPTLRDLVTGNVKPLTPFPDDNHGIQRRMRKPRGVVYDDGTIFLYSFVSEIAQPHTFDMYFFTAAILRPGDLAWTVVEKRLNWMSSDLDNCAAYHDGKILVWVGMHSWCVLTPDFCANGVGDDIARARLHRMPDSFKDAIRAQNYFLESRGEMLWVSIIVKHDWRDKHTSESLETRLLAKVHALEEQADGGSYMMRWVERDGRSIRDRVLFLGLPASFAANATQLDVEGGCAYFFFFGRLIRCNLSDGEAKFTEGPYLGWDFGDGCLWLRPQPVIAPITDIRGRVETRYKKKEIFNLL